MKPCTLYLKLLLVTIEIESKYFKLIYCSLKNAIFRYLLSKDHAVDTFPHTIFWFQSKIVLSTSFFNIFGRRYTVHRQPNKILIKHWNYLHIIIDSDLLFNSFYLLTVIDKETETGEHQRWWFQSQNVKKKLPKSIVKTTKKSITYSIKRHNLYQLLYYNIKTCRFVLLVVFCFLFLSSGGIIYSAK